MPRGVKPYVLGAAALFLVLYIAPLGARPMVVPDESRYAEIPREMLASGDWIVPRVDGLRYFEKPPLGYWLNAASMALFGETTFANRLPAALSAGGTAVIVCLLLGVFGGNGDRGTRWTVAVVGAAGLLTTVEVFGIATINILDSLFSFLVTASVAAFFVASETPPGRRRLAWLAILGGLCGLAFLTKGFLGLVLPVLAAGPYMIWQRRFRELLVMGWAPVAAAIVVAAPWSVAIALREGDFWHYFVFVEHLQRFGAAGGGQHAEPFWYYIPLMLAGALPWTALLPHTAAELYRHRPLSRLSRLALCWLIVPLLLFSASSGKLVTYALPCYPPLIILVMLAMRAGLDAGRRRDFDIAAWILGGILAAGVVAAAVLISLGAALPERLFALWAPAETWKPVALVVGLGAWSAALWVSTATRRPLHKMALWAASPALAMLGVHFAAPASFPVKMPQAALETLRPRIGPETILVADDRFVHVVCWTFKRDDVRLLPARGELEYGLGYADAAGRALSMEDFEALIADAGRTGPVVLVVRGSLADTRWETLPAPDWDESRPGMIIVGYEEPR